MGGRWRCGGGLTGEEGLAQFAYQGLRCLTFFPIMPRHAIDGVVVVILSVVRLLGFVMGCSSAERDLDVVSRGEAEMYNCVRNFGTAD